LLNNLIKLKVEILLFGRLTELVGLTHFQMENVLDTDALTAVLSEKYPSLQQVKYQVAVNQKVINSNVALADGMTVALMPPFSGG